jgi:hypothetical protein
MQSNAHGETRTLWQHEEAAKGARYYRSGIDPGNAVARNDEWLWATRALQ